MCRLAAYLGPKIALSEILYEPPHSLEHQSYAAGELLFGNVNVDGTGVAWWDGQAPEPLRYVTAEPPWKDANLPALAPRIRSTSIIAAVRSATPGLPFGTGNVAPFVSGGLAAVHNGWIGKFRGTVGRAMIATLPDDLYRSLDVMNDSKALFLMVVNHHSGDLADAVRMAVREVEALVRDQGSSAALNLVVGDGSRIVATRHSANVGVNSLYTSSREGAQLLASEPLDDGDDWKPVPERHLIEVTAESLTITPLET